LVIEICLPAKRTNDLSQRDVLADGRQRRVAVSAIDRSRESQNSLLDIQPLFNV
jgi:hypothetical protein